MYSQLGLCNAVPAGAIETLYDEHSQPRFKRADLGRFLGIPDIATTYRNVKTTPRRDMKVLFLEQTFQGPKHANPHDMFVTLGGALEIADRSRKPKAIGLTKWLARKGIEKLQDEVREQRQAIDEKDVAIAILASRGYKNIHGFLSLVLIIGSSNFL